MLKKPPVSQVRVPTLNQMGFAREKPHEIGRAFIDYASRAQGPLLDIGAAYGVHTIPALEKGGHVIATDLDERHLCLLYRSTPRNLRKNLILKKGHFPSEFHESQNFLGAVLASQVFHFLSGTEIVEGLSKIYRALMPGGQFFLSASTPYSGAFKQFIPLYEARKRQAVPWPGFVENTSFYAPQYGAQLPEKMLFLDQDTLAPLLIAAGFVIKSARYLVVDGQVSEDFKLDGREIAGFIVQKPE